MNNEEEVLYLYTIKPKHIIKDKSISEVPIRTPRSIMLSKEQVIKCLKIAAVYRRFPDRNEKVISTNVDRLHNEVYMTEEEYEEFLNPEENNTPDLEVRDHRGTVINTPLMEVSSEEEKEEEPEVEPDKEQVIAETISEEENQVIESTEEESSDDGSPIEEITSDTTQIKKSTKQVYRKNKRSK